MQALGWADIPSSDEEEEYKEQEEVEPQPYQQKVEPTEKPTGGYAVAEERSYPEYPLGT